MFLLFFQSVLCFWAMTMTGEQMTFEISIVEHWEALASPEKCI